MIIRPRKFGPSSWQESTLSATVNNSVSSVRFSIGAAKKALTTDTSAGFGGTTKAINTFVYGDYLQRQNNTSMTNIINTARTYYPGETFFGSEDKLQYILGPGSNPIKIGVYK